MPRSGKFIVLYGINNLGKSTQAKLLIEKLHSLGYAAEYVKYPIYDLAPTGPKLNYILRGGKKQSISEEELQQLYAQNRFDFEPTLEAKLASGVWIIAEDYIGTGLAWGLAKGASFEILEKQNQGLLKEDIGILFEGERFLSGKEQKHLHESNNTLMEKCRRTHHELGEKFDWIRINANQSLEQVQTELWNIINQKFHIF